MNSTLNYRPSTSGTIGSATNTLDRQASLTSFPSSRTASNPSIRNGAPATTPPMPGRGGSISSSRSPSTPSSNQRTAQRSEAARRSARLKSQYPADSTERHVEYILVASFHVDRGPIMEHQYPGAISGDENMLAELMLPDQAHVRKQDWTIFFLHKDTSEDDEKDEEAEESLGEGKTLNGHTTDNEEESQNAASGNGSAPKALQEQEEIEGGEGPPLIYVLNLVNTKQDTTAKRLSLYLLHIYCGSSLIVTLQRCCCQSNGNMYTTFFPTHL